MDSNIEGHSRDQVRECWCVFFIFFVTLLAPGFANGEPDCGCTGDTCRITDTSTLETCAAGDALANKVVYLDGTFTPSMHLVVPEGSTWRAMAWHFADDDDACTLDTSATIDGSLLPNAPGEIFGKGVVTLSEGSALTGVRITNVDPYISTNPCLDVIGDATVTDVHTTACSIGQRYMTPHSNQSASFAISHSCVSDTVITGLLVATGDIRITEGKIDPETELFAPVEDSKASITIDRSRIVDGLFNVLIFGGLGSTGAETTANINATHMVSSTFAAIRVVGGQDNMLDPYPGDHGSTVTVELGKDNVISDGIVGLQIEGGTFGGVPMASMQTSTGNEATVIIDESTSFGDYLFDAALIGSAGNLVDERSGNVVFAGEHNRITLTGKSPPGFTVDVQECSPGFLACPTSNETTCLVEGCP
ncbi:MAG: hypothetical protein R3192_12215 [Woeseiaceae bacterium]|nr:hypothetical protein [Woeseiaceae bacterium]